MSEPRQRSTQRRQRCRPLSPGLARGHATFVVSLLLTGSCACPAGGPADAGDVNAEIVRPLEQVPGDATLPAGLYRPRSLTTTFLPATGEEFLCIADTGNSRVVVLDGALGR